MKRNIQILFLFSILYLIVFDSKYASSQESLYKRLGGYDAITSVTDDSLED